MAATIDQIKQLVARGVWRVSDHAADEMDEDGILPGDVLNGVQSGEVVEDYPTFAKGPCVLVLQRDSEDRPLHVVWGIPAGATEPAVVVTAYRPDPSQWSADLRRRLS
jgi:hypothetical protein